MPKALIITEKPSVARDIAQALGGFTEQEGYFESDDHVLTFAVGHLFELLTPEELDERYKRWTLDALPILPEQLQLKKKKGHTDRIRIIQKLLERDDVDRVVNACDAGREGELIFREIVDFLGSSKPIERLWLQSMTTDAIRQGFQRLRPGQELEGLASAAQCRAWSDWLIGMNATRALTKRLKGRREKTAWSAGRVQTPTLALLVEREIEVLAHVPRPFWRVSGSFAAEGHSYQATYFDPAFRAGDDDGLKDDRLFDEATARAVADAVRAQAGSAEETRKPSRESAPPLFDLTSLQREGNRRFGWSARRTLDAAQRCYEAHKLLTYPRTDSRCLPNDYRETVDRVLESFAGAAGSAAADYAPHARRLRERGLENEARVFDDSGVSDHFAIIPTGVLPPVTLGADDRRLYDLVSRRFLGAFHPPAIWERVERVTTVSGHAFRTRARALTEAGWRAVLPGTGEDEDVAVLPPLRPGADSAEDVPVRTAEVEIEADETKPPARLSEARLLSLMENAGKSVDDENLAAVLHEKGIGTPATRAEIIENLIAKSYATRVGKGLRPTVKGMRLIDTLHRIHIERLASAALTGELEHHLGEVEHGRRSGADFMSEIRAYAQQIVEAAKTFEYDELYAKEPSLGPCPNCGRQVFEQAWFYRCEQVPGVSQEEDCPMRFWKDVSGRYLDRAAVAALLKDGRTPSLDGFTARDGRTYKGVLEVDREQWKVVVRAEGWSGEASNDQPEYEVDPTPLARCPICEEHDVVETPTHFMCAGRLKAEDEPAPASPAPVRGAAGKGKSKDDGRCGFILPRTVCKREIARAEAEPYVQGGKTELLTDFVSRYGRPFSATLVLKENGRHGFEFPPRKGAAATGEAASSEDGEKKPRAGTRRGTGGRARRAAGEEEAKPKAPPRRKAARRAGTAARVAKTPRGRASKAKATSESDSSS